MGVSSLNPAKYGRLCAEALPKVIEKDEEFDRMAAKIEALDRKTNLSPEEKALAELLAKLIEEYDDRNYPLPEEPPHRILLHLMEQKGLRQADLLPIFGSRSVASAVLRGKRELSKAHIRKLAEFFKVSPALFL
jgi:HTH-type transcriptional regulator / antitoxin HigA